MTLLEALKNICNHCEKEMGERKVACPFRSISNEYCEEYEEIKKSLKALEIIKERFDFDFALRFPNNQPMLRIENKRTNEYWELPIPKEEYELLKEVLDDKN